MQDFTKASQAFIEHYLGRPWAAVDGLPEAKVQQAETRLGVALPAGLRSFYLSVGAVDALCSVHNRILRPEELTLEEGYLIFMDENQSVVSWGIKQTEIAHAD